MLFNTRNTLNLVGKVSIWRDELPLAYYNSNILRLEFHPEYCGDSQYFGYALNSEESIAAIRELATGTTSVAAVYTRDLLKLEVALPSKAEQRTIAQALGDADRLIATLERLVAKKQAIKQGITQQLLTGKTRLPGFADEWTSLRLGDVGATYGGLTGKSKADFGHGVARFVTFVEVMNGARLYGQRLERVDVRTGERQNRVLRGDVLFNGSSESPEEVALATVVDFEPDQQTYLNSFCFGYRIHNDEQVDPWFLAYFFRSDAGRALVFALAQGATRYNISKTKLLQASLALPAIEEQKAIAEVLKDSDRELEALQQRLVKARVIKSGMMQELLTGRTRLPVEEATT